MFSGKSTELIRRLKRYQVMILLVTSIDICYKQRITEEIICVQSKQDLYIMLPAGQMWPVEAFCVMQNPKSLVDYYHPLNI